MALCQYSELVGGPCGPSLENRSSTHCVTIGECDKNVKDHLNHYKVWDTSVNSEEKLLLAQAGIFKVDDVSRAVTAEAMSQEGSTPLPVGWALSSSKKGNRFSDTQKRYLKDKRAAKLRRQGQSTCETNLEPNDDDIAAAEEEQACEDIRTLVLSEVQLRHPIVFDTYNLCKESKLNKLSIPMLRNVCDHFDINMEARHYFWAQSPLHRKDNRTS
ncbi:Hypothetical predicted protein [Paramuricea clavata]|uniref:Uncharacterized protein n=1 Tax=Paramuricea clavata TaxID=317549 RepID=A0A6S7GJ49_PARCT|nr:Hypothetical predicted protein [Paramuricea clavata]